MFFSASELKGPCQVLLLKAVQKEVNTCSGPVYCGQKCGKHESGEISYQATGFFVDFFPPSTLSGVMLWNPVIESPSISTSLDGAMKRENSKVRVRESRENSPNKHTACEMSARLGINAITNIVTDTTIIH